MKRPLIALVATSVLFLACSKGRDNSSWSAAGAGTTPAPATAAPTSPAPHAQGIGVGPVDHVDVAALDSDALAESGKAVFTAKCTACHKLDERYIGPALAGVTERRRPEWILNMILNPEKMIVEDATAKALLAEYIAPMANQSLTRAEAEKVLAYFLEYDKESHESHDDDDHEESAAVSH